ncbi:formylglycine-generating enzyme family protein [Candidatus Bipolaricaulota bacterium]
MIRRHGVGASVSLALIGCITLAVCANAPLPGQERIRATDSTVIVWVPPGTFVMGSTDAQLDAALGLCSDYRGHCSRHWMTREQPAHTVLVDGFWIDRTEVTNAQYAAFLNENGNQIEGGRRWLDVTSNDRLIEEVDGRFRPRLGYEDHPVVEVTWYGAAAYADWVGGRLPTEAEWEYAARGPTSAVFPWGEEFDGNRLSFCDVNCPFNTRDEQFDDGYVQTAPVGAFPEGASWVGAFDMAGNVWEWCADWFGESCFDESPSENPTGPETGHKRVSRGGAWGGDPYDVRSARRGDLWPNGSYPGQGFRCVMDPLPIDEAQAESDE